MILFAQKIFIELRRRVYIILKGELKYYTKDVIKFLCIMVLGFLLITAIIIEKYKPIYEVTISGEVIGYVTDKNKLQELIETQILEEEGKNIYNISLTENLECKLKLAKRKLETNEEEIIENISSNYTSRIYRYYIVALNDQDNAYVNTIEEAEKIVNEIKSQYDGDGLDLDLQIIEEYTENEDEVKTEVIEVAESNVLDTVEAIKQEKIRQEYIASLPKIKNVILSEIPVKGKITSRYGESSKRRKSTHTGLDIASSTGTDIKATSDGIVIFSAYSGSYGKLVKIDHGDGIETWYGHCSKLYVNVGDKVSAGDVISAVGSTGNSTGPHLHFEIRVNGNTVNPQDYLYN